MPYLSVTEYIARFGAQEAILLTFEGDPGTTAAYDSNKIETAISDAGDVIDGYVATRYATPIAEPPTVVIGWTAVLARESLYNGTGRTTQTIKDAADVVRSQLDKLALGRLSLPIPVGGEAPAQLGGGLAETSNDREPSVFGCGALDRLTDPFTGACDVPRWLR